MQELVDEVIKGKWGDAGNWEVGQTKAYDGFTITKTYSKHDRKWWQWGTKKHKGQGVISRYLITLVSPND